MSSSIRKKYIRYNNEKNTVGKSKESNMRCDKNYKTSTYINPKVRNREREKYRESKDNFYGNRIETKRHYNLSNLLNNNEKQTHANHANQVNHVNNNNNYNTNKDNTNKNICSRTLKNRRNLSQDFIKKNNKYDNNLIISVILTHEMDKIKTGLLKNLINNDDMNVVFQNVYEIIEDLIDEYNINNNCVLDKEENKKIIDNKFQFLKNNIMIEYRQINKEIYTKYYSNQKDSIQILNRLTPLSNFKKHCIKCKDIAIHKSKYPLYLIPNTNYIICKHTQDIYHKNNIECFCEYDGELYVTSCISSNSYKNQLVPLTFRNSLDDEMYLCSKCKHSFYYNYRNKKIKCIKCNNEDFDENNDIFYNELFFSKLKEEINFSLIMKRRSNPTKYCPCGGICYQGKFLDKYILVCSLCKKCQYDKRNGRYKYRLYLFKNMKNNNNINKLLYNPKNEKENENNNKEKLKSNNTYKAGNRNRNIIININRDLNINNNNRNKTNNLNMKEEKQSTKYNINDNDYLDKDKLSKIPKIKTTKTVQLKVVQDDNYKNKFANYNRVANKKSVMNTSNNNSELLHEDKVNNIINTKNKTKMYYDNLYESSDIVKNKRDLVKKKAILLLSSNNSKNNINPFITKTTSLVASRKERALKGNYMDKFNNSLDQINKLKINKLLMNSLDQNSFKALIDNIDPSIINEIKNELTRTLSFKKTITNNNSISKMNVDQNKKKTYNNNNHPLKTNIYANETNLTSKTLNRTKFIIPSNLNMNDYKILNLICSGSFSNIYQVQNYKTKKKFAVKKIIVEGQMKLEKLKRDIDLVQSISSGYFFEDINIVPIIQYYIKKLDLTAYALYELMPLAESDWNKKILKEKKNFTENELVKILKQLVKAFSYLQNNKICHRDIKPSNILIINGNYYIGDFNESKEINGNPNMVTEIRGTEAFLSPIMFEALIRNQKKIKHNLYKSDVYSLGLCFVFALTRNLYIMQKIKETKQEEKN